MAFSPPRRLLSLLPVTVAALVLGISGFFSAQPVIVSADDPIQCETEILASSGAIASVLSELEEHVTLSDAFDTDLLALSGAVADVNAYVAAYNEAAANHTSTSAIVTSLQAALNAMTGAHLTVSGAFLGLSESADSLMDSMDSTQEAAEDMSLCLDPEAVLTASGSGLFTGASPSSNTGAISGNDCPTKWARYQQALSNYTTHQAEVDRIQRLVQLLQQKLDENYTLTQSILRSIEAEIRRTGSALSPEDYLVKRYEELNRERLWLLDRIREAKNRLKEAVKEANKWYKEKMELQRIWADDCIKPTYNNA